MGNRIKELRKRAKISQEKLGDAVGTSRSQIVKLERGERRLTQEWMERLAKPLGVPAAALISADVPGNSDESETITLRKPASQAPQLPPRAEMPMDVEVRGTAAGAVGEGAFQLEDAVIDRVRRPPGIADARDVYALYVVGDSMSPRFEPGELIYVSERRPPRIGDCVVVQVQNAEHDGVQAYLKRMKRRSADGLVLEQFNPPGEMRLKAANVKAVHRVLTMNELFGV